MAPTSHRYLHFHLRICIAFLFAAYAAVSAADTEDALCSAQESQVWAANNLRKIAPPEYPVFSRREKHQGLVRLSLIVSPDGNIKDVVINKSSGYAELDASAVNAVLRSKFPPPACADASASLKTVVPISFTLSSPSDARGISSGIVDTAGVIGQTVNIDTSPLDPEKRKKIEKLLRISGALSLGKQLSETFVKQMTANMKKQYPQTSANVFDLIEEEVNKTIADSISMPGGLVDSLTKSYHRYYSAEDIDALIVFYESPIGKKTVLVTPVLSQETLTMGMRLGQMLGPIVVERVKARLKQKGFDV